MSDVQPVRGIVLAEEPMSWDELRRLVNEGLEDLAAAGNHVIAVESIRFGDHALPGVSVHRGYLVEGIGVPAVQS